MAEQTALQRLKTLSRQASAPSLQRWPAGSVGFDSFATPEQVQWKDWLMQQVSKAYPGEPMPVIRVLRADAHWRDDMKLLAANADLLEPLERLHILDHLTINLNALAEPTTYTLYLSEAFVKALEPKELASLIGHETGHLFLGNEGEIATRIYGDTLPAAELSRKAGHIAECQADRFTPRELRPAAASALRKISSLDPEMMQLARQIRTQAGIAYSHPDIHHRIQALLSDTGATDLALTAGLSLDAECNLLPAPPAGIRPQPTLSR